MFPSFISNCSQLKDKCLLKNLQTFRSVFFTLVSLKVNNGRLSVFSTLPLFFFEIFQFEDFIFVNSFERRDDLRERNFVWICGERELIWLGWNS